MNRKDEPNDFHLVRIVSERRLGNLLGQIKEIIEASIQDKEQRNALKNIIADKFYDWFGDIGDKLTQEEADEAQHLHWGTMEDGRNIITPDHSLDK